MRAFDCHCNEGSFSLTGSLWLPTATGTRLKENTALHCYEDREEEGRGEICDGEAESIAALNCGQPRTASLQVTDLQPGNPLGFHLVCLET